MQRSIHVAVRHSAILSRFGASITLYRAVVESGRREIRWKKDRRTRSGWTWTWTRPRPGQNLPLAVEIGKPGLDVIIVMRLQKRLCEVAHFHFLGTLQNKESFSGIPKEETMDKNL